MKQVDCYIDAIPKTNLSELLSTGLNFTSSFSSSEKSISHYVKICLSDVAMFDYWSENDLVVK